MPPKRKVPARRASAGKNVSISGSTVIPTTAVQYSDHPRRETAVGVDYKLTASRAPHGSPKKQAKSSQGAPAPKATGTPPGEIPKRRGRPPKAAITNDASPKTVAAAPAPIKVGRGRPKKTDATPVVAVPAPTSAKRQRDDKEPQALPPKKRGRPSKADATHVEAPKKRGRPANTDAIPAVNKTRKPHTAKVQKEQPNKAALRTKAATKPTSISKTAAKPVAKRGRPPGSTNKSTTKKASTTKSATTAAKRGPKPEIPEKGTETEAEDFIEGLTQDSEQDADGLQYWLMKAEPNTRIEKGVDVAYPIDKLAEATEPEPWDGVRNPVARNNMRAMRKDDLAFFYHSNCDVPGIVGVMRVVEEHDVDESAFDPAHPYFDEKSDRSKPKWDCVKVEFVKKFNEVITLKELKSTPELSDMQVAQKAFGRLSVQKVTPAQWQFVLKMANEPEDLGVTSLVSGYEADTNGETDKEAVENSVGADEIEAEKIAAYGSPNEAAEDVMSDEEAVERIAAYGPDDLTDDVVEDGDIANIQPKVNGHSTSAHDLVTTDRMDGLDR